MSSLLMSCCIFVLYLRSVLIFIVALLVLCTVYKFLLGCHYICSICKLLECITMEDRELSCTLQFSF